MARKRTEAHRKANESGITERDLQRHQGGPVDEPDEREVRRHSGMPADDDSEMTRPMAEDEPAAKMPDAVDEERDRLHGGKGGDSGLPEPEEHDFRPAPMGARLAEPPPRPEYREIDTRTNAPGGAEGYTVLARRGDIEAASEDYAAVPLDAAWPADPAAPLAGEEGGAPLGEETTAKHHPGATWPGPLESDAAAPTASPAPGPEPTVQYNPPQDIEFTDPPEAAAGVKEAPPPPPPEGGARTDKPDRTKRYSTREPEPPRRQSEGEVERDEAGQVSIEKMAEKALEGVGGLWRGLGEDDAPQPHRIQKALELAARRVMSIAWWDVKQRFFDGSRDEGPEPEPVAAE